MVRRRLSNIADLPKWVLNFDESAWPGSNTDEKVRAWRQAAMPYCSPSGFSCVDLFKLSRSHRRALSPSEGNSTT